MPRVGVTVYDLLLSCPGDVLDLKETIASCVKSFNSSIGEANNIRIELKHWSTDSFSQSGDKPQNILNHQFIDECDLCVALLGIRFGTPTDNYDSGTEEEIEKMLEQNKQVFLYFVERNVDPSKIDLDQYRKVQEFKDKYSDKGVYTIVKSTEELRSSFQNALSLYFIKLVAPNTAQLQPTLSPKLVISSKHKDGDKIVPFHTDYQSVKLVKDKENGIKELIEIISNIIITPSSEESYKASEAELSDEELQGMTVSDIMKSPEGNIILNSQLYRLMGGKHPEYKKIEIEEKDRQIIDAFCKKHSIDLNSEFYYLGNLQREIKVAVFTAFGNSTASNVGSDSEKEKYKLIQDLVDKLREYNDVIDYLESIDAMPCISLQVENQGNTFDEDIDIKLFIEQGIYKDIDSIPKPGVFFLEEANILKTPRALFSGHHDADIEDFSNYPDIPYIPKALPLPFKSADDEIAEQQEEYQDMLENVFCYDLRDNGNDDILCFNIPYLKQNTKMFFPSYLFFYTLPASLRYEIRSKHSPDVYSGTLVLADGGDV